MDWPGSSYLCQNFYLSWNRDTTFLVGSYTLGSPLKLDMTFFFAGVGGGGEGGRGDGERGWILKIAF